MRRTAVIFLALPLLFGPAAAQDIDCANAVTQTELNICAADEYDAADLQLNRVWTKARAFAKRLDSGLEPRLQGAEKALVAAQRGWIAYRDGHCTLAGFDARGGSMEPMLVSGCLADLTRKRTAEIEDFLASGNL